MGFFSFRKNDKRANDVALGSTAETKGKLLKNSSPGTCRIRWTKQGLFLCVTSPVGTGVPIVPDRVLKVLQARGVHSFDEEKMRAVVQDADGTYRLIGPPAPEFIPEADCTVSINTDKHYAFITLTVPETGQRDVEIDVMKEKLQDAGVVFGVDEAVLEGLCCDPVYGNPITVATWKRTVHGCDAEIRLQFEAKKENEITLKEVDGRVDYRELSIVQSIPAGTVLAVKTPLTEGEAGILVTGELVPAKPGKDYSLSAGKNVTITDDGLQVIAQTSGQPILRGRKIEVDAECVVQDVTMETGNIDFEGHILVRGNIEDGFTVRSTDTVEVMGLVGAAKVFAGGDIRVKGGIMGKGHSHIQADGSVYAKFIDKADVDAGVGVYADDGITHSLIDAGDEVICVNKRGAIFGGRIRAGNLVEANLLGNVAAPKTIVQVGLDPEKRQRLKELDEERRINMRETEFVDVNLEALNKIKSTKGRLSAEKQKKWNELSIKQKALSRQRRRLEAEEEALNDLPYDVFTNAQIIVRDRAFPNVHLQIGNPQKLLQSEETRKVFSLQEGEISEKTIGKEMRSANEK